MFRFRALILSAVSTAVLVAAGAAALAADLPTHKTPPSAPVAAAPNWAGAYFGVEGGLAWANTDWNTTALDPIFPTPVDANSADASFTPYGGRLGAFAGYNLMLSATTLAGVEGDVAGDFFENKSQTGIPGTAAYIASGGPTTDTVSAKSSSYDASARLRFGVLATPSTLLFATGGVAFADPKYAISCLGPVAGTNSWCASAESGSTDSTRVGWTMGLGLETVLSGNWLLRAEYRYSGFPDKKTTLFANGGGGADLIAFRTSYETNSLNVGLAYKF